MVWRWHGWRQPALLLLPLLLSRRRRLRLQLQLLLPKLQLLSRAFKLNPPTLLLEPPMPRLQRVMWCTVARTLRPLLQAMPE